MLVRKLYLVILTHKNSHGYYKIILIESEILIAESIKIAQVFNDKFESVTDFLHLFNWPCGSLESNDDQIIKSLLNFRITQISTR